MKHFAYNALTSYSSEQLFQTMCELKMHYPAAEQMFRRMVFNVVARNCNDHTNNFSLRLKKADVWELLLAYDNTATTCSATGALKHPRNNGTIDVGL